MTTQSPKCVKPTVSKRRRRKKQQPQETILTFLYKMNPKVILQNQDYDL